MVAEASRPAERRPERRGELVEPLVEGLTHLDAQGQARMVDITKKAPTQRQAVAKGRVVMRPETLRLIRDGALAKGDVLAVARLAGIMAAKKTPELIPLAHPLLLTQVAVDLELDEGNSAVEITARAKTTGPTGVEMEALVAVAAAALTIYDMAKAVDRGMRIQDIRLVSKRGGRSGPLRQAQDSTLELESP